LAPQTKQRLAGYIFSAAQAGADAIVVTCSTLGEAVNSIRPMSAVPLFRIDQGMADEAVKIATRIGILATLPTTLEPTGTMIRRAAIAACKECTVVEKLCSGAFQLLTGGDKKGHDALVMEGFEELASQVEVVVLAQASMAQALASLKRPGVPYLTSQSSV
jgi:aspartate/glutamate racemase